MHALGIDVGGTKIAGAVLDTATSHVVCDEVIPTDRERSADQITEDVIALGRRLIAQALLLRIDVRDIGVTVPELVDLDGTVRSAESIDWRGVDLGHLFGAAISGLPTVRALIQPDVVAGALGEARFGAGVDAPSFLYVSVGTGVSSTFVIEGRAWTGANGNAVVLASGSIPITCNICGKSTNFVPENHASGQGIVRHYREHRQDTINSAAEIVTTAEQGDALAASVVTGAGRTLGVIVAMAVNLLDPHRVIVGGGLGTAGGLYWEAFLESLRHHIWADSSRQVPVMCAALGPYSAVWGAIAPFTDSAPARNESGPMTRRREVGQ